MKEILFRMTLIAASLLLILSCSDEKVESKNMEQIYQEEGVPVKVKSVERTNFENQLIYNTVLTGIRESAASAMIGGRIEEVLIKVGDFVKKDQVIITFPTDNPATQYYQSKVTFENAKNTYERYEELYDMGGISKNDFENIKTQYEVSKANWETVQKMVKILAPISGYVTKLAVKETDDVKKEALLATIADLRKLKATIQISEDEISNITRGTKAYAEWQGNKIEGIVTEVDMAMNPATNSFNADVVFENPDQIIKAGVTADITILGTGDRSSISIERKNLIKKGDNYSVFVVENNLAKKRDVIVGRASGLFVEIKDGLNENDQLVVEGQMFLEDNSKVKIIN
jgi:RND family efflux transporter MFP subunit